MAKTRKSKESQSDGRKDAIMHRDLASIPVRLQEAAFKRADLVFEGVDHAQGSYEVRVFLNNKNANEQTARSPETGYAGRFVVFGHGRLLRRAGPLRACARGGAGPGDRPERRPPASADAADQDPDHHRAAAAYPELVRQEPQDADLRAGLEGAAARAARPGSRSVQVPPGVVADLPGDPAGDRPLHRGPEGARCRPGRRHGRGGSRVRDARAHHDQAAVSGLPAGALRRLSGLALRPRAAAAAGGQCDRGALAPGRHAIRRPWTCLASMPCRRPAGRSRFPRTISSTGWRAT